jgi:hypothetical protein
MSNEFFLWICLGLQLLQYIISDVFLSAFNIPYSMTSIGGGEDTPMCCPCAHKPIYFLLLPVGVITILGRNISTIAHRTLKLMSFFQWLKDHDYN